MGAYSDVTTFERKVAELAEFVKQFPERIVRDAEIGSNMFKNRAYAPTIGSLHGLITVTGYKLGTNGGLVGVLAKCACGSGEYLIDQNSLKRKVSSKCNVCAKKASATKRYWKYSEAMPNTEHRTRLLNRLAAAITRCNSQNDVSYKNYGGRGIRVCSEWVKDRSSFLKHVQTIEGWDVKEFEMDRIDCDGNYEPGNLRFVPRSVNMKNKRQVSVLQSSQDFYKQQVEELNEYVVELEAKLQYYEELFVGDDY